MYGIGQRAAKLQCGVNGFAASPAGRERLCKRLNHRGTHNRGIGKARDRCRLFRRANAKPDGTGN